MPANSPLPNATFGSLPAACHYSDGTFIPDQNQNTCPSKAPRTGAKFTFWHPDLITMHVWVWYPNPAGLFSGTNPLVARLTEASEPITSCGTGANAGTSSRRRRGRAE
jgi:hypothetical protein